MTVVLRLYEIFTRQVLFSTAIYQGLLKCNHSKAHNFKKDWKGGTIQIGVCGPLGVGDGGP